MCQQAKFSRRYEGHPTAKRNIAKATRTESKTAIAGVVWIQSLRWYEHLSEPSPLDRNYFEKTHNAIIT